MSSSSTGSNVSPSPPSSSSSTDSWPDILLIVILCLSVLFSSYFLFLIRRLWRELSDPTEYPSSGGDARASPGSDGPNDENTTKNWKISASDIELGEVIGQGALGKVYKGKWRGLTVAIKELFHSCKEEAIQSELRLLIKVRHPNLLLFMGIATPAQDRLWIVSEYMARGNLYSLLHDKSVSLDWKRRCAIALDCARAMNYLHCSKPHAILHKSLNSINILVDRDFVSKVADYGLDAVRSSAKKVGLFTQPLWVAPEIFKKNKPTKSSDVYSFGIILWEIFTRRTPYQGKISAANNVKTIQQISEGLRPEMPKEMPSKLRSLIESCWQADSNKRPLFENIVETLAELEKERISADVLEHLGEEKSGGATRGAADRSKDGLEALIGSERKPWMIASEELKFEEMIGSGSFGEVYKGTFRGKRVAIKKLMQINQENLQDFIRELNIMCSLRHPNIVLFMGACLEPNNFCLVMEFCEKGSLYSILHDVSESLDYSKILRILLEVAEGMAYLHLNNPPIIHRDLKSLNVLMLENGSCRISDFGLTDFKSDSMVDSSGRLQLGSPFWQAPEAMEHSLFTEASDVYSFGIIIWELFTRELPFGTLNPHQAALAVIADDKRPEIPAFVPPKFVHLMEQCWARDPKVRPKFPEIISRLKELKREGLPRIELSLDNAGLYRKKTTVFAFRSKDAVIVYKSWGTGEGKKGDWVLVGPGEDVYTCDAAIFAKTYSRAPEQAHMYRKTEAIFALQMKRDFLMETLEGMEHGSAGDWIAQNPVDGEQWPIAAKTFQEMYELAPQQTLSPAQQAAREAKMKEKAEKEKEVKQ